MRSSRSSAPSVPVLTAPRLSLTCALQRCRPACASPKLAAALLLKVLKRLPHDVGRLLDWPLGLVVRLKEFVMWIVGPAIDGTACGREALFNALTCRTIFTENLARDAKDLPLDDFGAN